MPRDANGNYTLPAGNPVATNTNIESTWANSTMGDIAAEITDSLSRSGKGGVTGPFQIIDFETTIPGLAFANEPTSGLKRSANGDVRVQILGTDKQRWRSGVSQRPEVQVDAVWHPVAIEPADRKVMYGAGGTTATWFYNNTVPPGWTLTNPDTNLRNLAIAPGGATPVGGGTVAGTVDPSAATLTTLSNGVTVGHVLTIAEMPSHDHPGSTTGFSYATNIAGNDYDSSGPTNSEFRNIVNVAAQGGNQGHLHNVTDLPGTAAFDPRRAMGVIGVLDA